MTIYDYELTPDQISAGLAAMTGRFTGGDVRAALQDAGVPIKTEINSVPRWITDRAADRLIQQERNAGRISNAGRFWERIT